MERIWFRLASSCGIASMGLCMGIQLDKDRGIAGQKFMSEIAPMGLCMKIWSEKDYKNLIRERSWKFDPIKIITWSWLVQSQKKKD